VKSAAIQCPNCAAEIPVQMLGATDLQPCPQCERPQAAEVFPAFLRGQVQGTSPERLVIDAQASCFFHPQKKAVVACGRCGRFVCALCDLEVEGQHVCPTCLQLGRNSAELSSLEPHRILYDNVALGLAILPVLAWPTTIVTAPAAIFVAIFYWKRPSSILPRTKVRAILAIVFALMQIAAWTTFLVMMWHGKA
jgi:hypothetical protein